MDEYELYEKEITEALAKYRASKKNITQRGISSFIRRSIISWICTIFTLTKILQHKQSTIGTLNKKGILTSLRDKKMT